MSEELIPLRKNNKKGLGRGLGSLLGEVESATNPEPVPIQVQSTVVTQLTQPQPVKADIPIKDRILKIGIEKLKPNKEQPRKSFDAARIQELANSIKEKGMILPIVVKSLSAGDYQIVAGERRWRAAQQAGLHEVPVIVREASDGETLELAIIENIQRQDLNPIEEAEAYGLLANKYKLTQDQIAQKVSKERSTVANLLRLNALAPEIKSFVRNGELTLGHAKVLLSITEVALQVVMAKKTIQQKLSVRALEKMVVKLNEKKLDAEQIESQIADIKQLNPLINELQKMFGTKVDISPSGKGFKVAFYLYSTPELNQFAEKLRKSDR